MLLNKITEVLNIGLILPQFVYVKVHNFTRKYYELKGYTLGKIGEKFLINILDLPASSTQLVSVKCDFCDKVYEIEYRKYLLQNKNGIACSDCRYKKIEITNLERYGNKCSLRNEQILNKSKETNLKKLGVEYPFQSKYILDKIIDIQIKNNGKIGRAVNTSSQQIYLNNLYGGELNYFIKPYCIDIYFKNENIICEYDGGGHNMLVKYGKLTENEFKIKEDGRSDFLQKMGYKEFHIISTTDKLPKDEDLINIKKNAFYYLLNQNGKYYSYNIDTKKIITF